MASKLNELSLVEGLLFARNHAARWGKWVVAVVPTGDPIHEARHIFSTLADENFSGRTALLEGNARLSLITPEQEVFVPKAERFSVIFLGWGMQSTGAEHMSRWRNAAHEELGIEQ